MRSSNWMKFGGLAVVAAILVLSGVFNVQAGPLGQATAAASQEVTAEPTQMATEAPTAVPTEAATEAAAATKYPPCPGVTTLGTEEATAAATVAENATAAATVAVFNPGFLGVAGEDVDSCGIRVTDLAPDSPADQAGFKVNDIIVAANGTAYTNLADFRTFIEGAGPGAKVDVVVKRDGAEVTISAVLAARPDVTPPTVAPEATAVPTEAATAEPTANATSGQ